MSLANVVKRNVTVVQRTDFPECFESGYAERLLDELPVVSRDDPNNPEWPATSVTQLELPEDRYGQSEVYVKDEGDLASNPAKTLLGIPHLLRMWLNPRFLLVFLGLILQKLQGSPLDLHRTTEPEPGGCRIGRTLAHIGYEHFPLVSQLGQGHRLKNDNDPKLGLLEALNFEPDHLKSSRGALPHE